MKPQWFEDYAEGRVLEFGNTLVDRDELLEFAHRWDPQPFHTDPAAAAASVFGGLIASGFHTCAMMMRMLADHFLDPVSSLGSPGLDELRWRLPVRPGDRLRLKVTIVEARPSRSKPDRGMVTSRLVMLNQDDAEVMTLTAMILVLRRPE